MKGEIDGSRSLSERGRRIFRFFLAGLISTSVMAGPVDDAISPHRLAIQVNGVVCSFCAYGVEKNLARLDFLDKSRFGGDGVLIDINSHRITLALQKDKPVHYAAIADAIVKGGYDPVVYYATIQGIVEKSADGFQLVSRDKGQVYILPETIDAAPLLAKPILVTTELNAEQIADSRDNQPIRLTTVKLEPQP